MRMRSQAIFAYIMSPWPLTFDLHEPKFGRNPSICSKDNTVLQDVFAYMMCASDLWQEWSHLNSSSTLQLIHDLSLAGIHQSVLQITRSWAVFAYIISRCDLCPLTLWPQNLISSLALQDNIHDLSLAGIHQSVLEITRSRAVFAYIMSPVTLDLWTDPKI